MMYWKFNIGDTVAHVLPVPGGAKAMPMLVVERLLQECQGGIQRSYRCRMSSKHLASFMLADALHEFAEIELVKFEEPKP